MSDEIAKVVADVVRKNYILIEDLSAIKDVDGAQMWDGQWWMPIFGCDTLDNLIDDLVSAFSELKEKPHERF